MSGNEVPRNSISDIGIDISFIKTEQECSEGEYPVKVSSLTDDTRACSSASSTSNYIDNNSGNMQQMQENISEAIIKSEVLESPEDFIMKEEEASEGHSQLKDIEAVYIPTVYKCEELEYVETVAEKEDINKYVKEELENTTIIDTECSGSNCEVATDDVLDNETNIDSKLTEEFHMKFKQEDISEYELEELKTKTNEDTECSGPSGSNCAAATDDVLDNKINSGSILTEEFDINSDEEAGKYEFYERETSTDEDTEITQIPQKKHKKTDTGQRQCSNIRSNYAEEKQLSGKRFEYEQCEKTFSGSVNFKKHKYTHTENKPLSCDHCDMTFLFRSQFITHRRTHTGEKPFKCDHCDKMFSQKAYLKLHKRTHTGEKPFKCDQCDKMCSLKSNLIIHKRTHMGEKPFKCDQCDKMFSQRAYLISHKRTHTDEKSFKCDQCDKMFTQASSLIVHKRTHTGEKPFKCDHCEKMFSRKSNLIVHKRTHTGEKPFKCDQCDKIYSQAGTLIKHKRNHTGEKPFQCDQCDKMFSGKSNLNAHKRTHMDEKPFKCDQCDKMFSQSSSLIYHKRSHTGEKPFKCDQCDKMFAGKTNLNAHKLTHK